jgi:hypothetical protein
LNARRTGNHDDAPRGKTRKQTLKSGSPILLSVENLVLYRWIGKEHIKRGSKRLHDLQRFFLVLTPHLNQKVLLSTSDTTGNLIANKLSALGNAFGSESFIAFSFIAFLRFLSLEGRRAEGCFQGLKG